MKKYRFAKLYLTGLLVAAILITTIGVLVGLYYGVECTGELVLSQTLLKKPVTIDTASAFNAFQNATAILSVNNLVPSTTTFTFDRKVPCEKSAQLSLNEIADFEAVVAQMSDGVAKLRQQCTANMREIIEQMLAGSRAALPPQTTLPQSAPTTIPRQTPPHRTFQHLPLLFVTGAVTHNDIEMLKFWSNFLELQLRNYTPSAGAQALAVRADTDLQVLISFLMQQLDSLRGSREIVTDIPEIAIAPSVATNVPVTATERENRIREFISLLQRFESSIDSVIAREWVVDQELAIAKKAAEEAKARIYIKISEAKWRAAIDAKNMTLWVVGALVVALLLLVVRDFMSALIDTAANTGGMLDLMTPKDSDKTNEA